MDSPTLRRPASSQQPLTAAPHILRVMRFWIVLAWETIGRRRLQHVVRQRLDRSLARSIRGADHIPLDGSFILAINHYNGISTLDVLAEAITVLAQRRPEMVDRCIIVVGARSPTLPGRPSPTARLARKFINWFYQRWSANAIRISGAGTGPSIRQLREWKSRSSSQPVLLFPEGKARLFFGAVRKGSGRWLAAIGVPVLPVGIWYSNGIRNVSIGRAINWSPRPELQDIQLGLSIAELLPPEFAPQWQDTLERWRQVHGATPSRPS